MADAAPPQLITARVLRGTLETPGAADNPVIMEWPRAIARQFPDLEPYTREYTHDSIAWCGLLAAFCCAVNGIRPPPQFLWALNWSHWGTPTSSPRPGDVAVFHRDGGGHVAFFEGFDGDRVVVTGGNQADSVSTASPYTTANLVGFFRPPAPEKLPLAGNIPESGWETGKGSWYSQLPPKWVDSGDRPNSNALGVPDHMQGIALYSRATLGSYFDVVTPDGRLFTHELQTDIGPHPNTGRKIDISAALAERMGYSPNNFPTDSIFKWRPSMAAPQQEPIPVPTPTPQISFPNSQSFPQLDPAMLKEIDKMLEPIIVSAVERILPKVVAKGPSILSTILSGAVTGSPFIAIGLMLLQVFLTNVDVMGMPGPGGTATANNTAGSLIAMFVAGWANWFRPKEAK